MCSSLLHTARTLLLAGALLTGCGTSGDAPAASSPTPSADAAGADGAGADGVGGDADGAATTVPAEPEDLGPSPMETVPLSSDSPHLAVVVDLGGDCAGTFCVDVLELLADGQWTLTTTSRDTGASSDPGIGTFDVAELADLAADVDQNAIVLGPFNGLCPTEDGGTERFYRVYAPTAVDATSGADEGDGAGGEMVLEVSSCREQLDADAPVIVALDLLMAAAGPVE